MKKQQSVHDIMSYSFVVLFAAAALLGFFALGHALSQAAKTDAAGNDTAYEAPEGFVGAETEMRGIWVPTVANISFPSKTGLKAAALRAELDAIVENCRDAGLNAIFFQVRPCLDALYDSELFPSSGFLAGTQGEPVDGCFDCLAYLLQKASAYGIAVHAWVNPFRVATNDKAAASLADNNFAVLHPEYAVRYADGKTYLDPGYPQVREYVVSGVKELVENYPTLAGVHFDDYFYPYPSGNEPFDDNVSYALYGDEKDKDEWRRENINALVEDSYNAVKDADPSMLFGVSPFGIYMNEGSSDSPVRGSATKGLEAYKTLYCDALAWAKGGYVDYIAPQLYWTFDTAVAPYGVLADWWDANLAGTKCRLYIGHAAYKAGDYTGREIGRQVKYARKLKTYGGSIFYAYNDYIGNTGGVRDAVTGVFSGLGDTAVVGEVLHDYAYLKASPDSDFYTEDYTPASKGMRDYVVGVEDEYYHLAFGGYVAKEDMQLVHGEPLSMNIVLGVDCHVNGTDTRNHDDNFTDVVFRCLERCPVNASASDGKINVTFYNTLTDIIPQPTIADNPVVASISAFSPRKNILTYTVKLRDVYCNFGYNVVYENGNIILRLNNPQTLSDTPDKPLDGKRIVIDAGHGGSDTGAPGCGSIHENTLNLRIALYLQKELENLGATVIMTRTEDKTVDLTTRMAFFNETYPDFLISVHQNSLTSASAHGFLGLYCAQSGQLAAKTISDTVTTALNRYEYPARYQELAVARNHRFPSTLCEMCFISNPSEYQWSMSEANLKLSAKALRDGILAYYEAQEKYLENE